jgi:hypothetical protein
LQRFLFGIWGFRYLDVIIELDASIEEYHFYERMLIIEPEDKKCKLPCFIIRQPSYRYAAMAAQPAVLPVWYNKIWRLRKGSAEDNGGLQGPEADDRAY